MSAVRFEIVRTDAEQPWHARFVAANGRVVWTTESYTRRKSALNAICVLVDGFGRGWVGEDYVEGADGEWRYVDAVIHRVDHWEKRDARLIEIRDVDERVQP